MDLVDDLPARHHDHPVAEPGQLERVTRLDDDRDAFLRLRAQGVIDVEPGADVHALRGLLGEDDPDVSAQERARQRDLLLVAPRKRLDGLLNRRHANTQAANELGDGVALPPPVEEAHAPQPPEDLDRGVCLFQGKVLVQKLL